MAQFNPSQFLPNIIAAYQQAKNWSNDPSNPGNKVLDSLRGGANNVLDATTATAQGIGRAVTGKPQVPLTSSQQKGMNTVQDLMYGNPVLPEIGAAANTAEGAGRQIVNETKAGAAKVAKTADEAINAAKIQPGGLQAGFAKIPKIAEFPTKNTNAVNTWSPLIRDDATGTIVNNPNFKPGGSAPTQYSQKSTDIGTGYTEAEKNQIRQNMGSGSTQGAAPSVQTPTTLPPIQPIKQNFLTKAGNAIKSDIGKTISPDAAKNPFGPEETIDMQNALMRNGVDNYTKAPAAARNLYDNIINPELRANPNIKPIDSVVDGYTNAQGQYIPGIVNEMQKLNPGLNANEAKIAANSVINDMYDISRNTGQTASSIDDASLLKIKTDLNSTIPVKNYYNGTPPSNDRELAMVAARKAISGQIADAHPNIAQATKDYGLISDAMPSLLRAHQQGRGIGLYLPNIGRVGLPSAVGGPIRDATGGTLRVAGKVADTPVGKALGVAGLIGGGAALQASGLPQEFIKNYTQQGTTQAEGNIGSNQQQKLNVHIPTSIPQSLAEVKPEDGIIDPKVLKGADGQPFASNVNTIQAQIADLNAKKKLPAYQFDLPNTPGNKGDIDGQIATLESKKTISENANEGYAAANTFHGDIIDAKQAAQNAPSTLFKDFPTYAALQAAFNGKYALLAQKLQNLTSNYPGIAKSLLDDKGNFKAMTPEVLSKLLDGADTLAKWGYYQQLQKQMGTPNQSPYLPPITPSPTSAPAIPRAYSVANGTGQIPTNGVSSSAPIPSAFSNPNTAGQIPVNGQLPQIQ